MMMTVKVNFNLKKKKQINRLNSFLLRGLFIDTKVVVKH